MQMTSAEFEELVTRAIDSIPSELLAHIDNCAILVENDPPDGQPLLGLYEGIPLTSRQSSWYAGVLPDRIRIFRNPILATCDTHDQVEQQVRITVVHEIAHHFGIDDARLTDLGYG